MQRRELNALLLGGTVTAAASAWPQAGARRPVLGSAEFVVNLKAVKAQGLSLPQTLLVRADEVIE